MPAPGATAPAPGRAVEGGAYAPYAGYRAPGARGGVRVALSAQATRSQQAIGNLTLQLRPDADIERAQVAVRASQVGIGEAIVWQGRLNGRVENNLNIPVGPPAVALPANVPRELIVSGSSIAPQTYYLFSPSAYPSHAPGAQAGAPLWQRAEGERRRADTWLNVLQASASRQRAYILAPAGFPLGQLAPADAETSGQGLADALNRSGYRSSARPGVITIEPSATLRAAPASRARRTRP